MSSFQIEILFLIINKITERLPIMGINKDLIDHKQIRDARHVYIFQETQLGWIIQKPSQITNQGQLSIHIMEHQST
ncbi:hypothetical protein ALC53_01343 [Atta colombica]|uniref:Uncharacterized protein n=1 Tax=Atta colombica TaxID=520822 RepID=A0A151I6I5_9HYME|nr:hypothetical protein ALC53_01343 [Atta colombica]